VGPPPPPLKGKYLEFVFNHSASLDISLKVQTDLILSVGSHAIENDGKSPVRQEDDLRLCEIY
jgi:hypothetical protein